MVSMSSSGQDGGNDDGGGSIGNKFNRGAVFALGGAIL